MSDYWRRATAVPSMGHQSGSPYRSSMNVVIPGLNASYSHGQTYPLDSSYPHDTRPDYRPSPPDNRAAARDAANYEYDEARRTYVGILQRERAELDMTKHEVDALAYDKQHLRKELSEAESRAAAAARERDIANAKLVSDTAGLRAQSSQAQSEANSLREELNKVHQAYTSALLERSQYEALVANLRAEVVAAGRTIVDQTGTIRSLTHEMSRRDPYHLIKERRERDDNTSSIDGSKLQVTIATLEEQVKALQAKLTVAQNDKVALEAQLKAEVATAATTSASKVSAASDAFRAQEQTLLQKLTALEKERAVLYNHAQESSALADKLTFDLNAAKVQAESDRQLRNDLSKQLEDLKKGAGVVSQPPTKALPQALPDVERKQYESKITELLNTLRDTRAQVKAAHSVFTQLDRGDTPADVKTAALVDATISVISAEGLLERDAANKGKQDPYIVVIDAIGDKIIETDPSTDTNSPKYNPTKDRALARLARNSPSSTITIEAWSKSPDGKSAVFLGAATVTVKSILDGGNTQRSVTLGPRDDEQDEQIRANKSSLGSVTIGIQLAATGAKVASKPSAADASRSLEASKPVDAAAASAKPANAAAKPAEPTPPPPPPPAPVVVKPKPIAREQPKTDAAQDVVFHVFGCDQLLHRDTLGTKSDPYVIILREGGKKEVFRTSCMSDEDTPRWARNEKSCKTLKVQANDPDPFIFQVWDDDSPASDEFLGQASMTAAEILAGSGPRTMKLQARPNETDEEIKKLNDKLGSLTVDVTIVSEASTKEKRPAEVTNPDGKPVASVLPTAEEVKAVSTGPAQKMLIYVKQCNGLIKRSGFLASNTDPYVEVKGPTGDTMSTPIVPKCTDPTWSAVDASMQTIIAPSDVSYFTFDVLDDEKVMGPLGPSSKFLGRATISCNALLAIGEGTRTLPLQPRDNETDDDVKKNVGKLGTITIQLSRIYSAPGTSSTAGGATPAAGGGATNAGNAAAAPQALPPVVDDMREVIVTVCEAKGVLARNVFKGSDIYVAIIGVDGKEKHRTITRDNSTHATWSDIEGRCSMLMSPAQTQHFIAFEVWDYETVGSHHFLGYLKLPVPTLFELNGQTRTEKLVPKPGMKDKTVDENAGKLGTITFKVAISGLSTRQLSSMIVGDISNRRAAPSTTQPFPVRVWVKGCDGLRNRQANGEISDPYVTIKDTNGQTHQTPTKDNVLSPTWSIVEGSMKTTLNPTDDAGFLVFEVSDVGYIGGMKRMGMAQISVKDLIKDGFGERTFKLGVGPKENDPELKQFEDSLGTITVEIVPDNAAAGAPAAQAAPGGANNALAAQAGGTAPIPCTIQILSGEKLLKRHTISSPLIEVYAANNQLLFSTPSVAQNLNPVWASLPGTSSTTALSPLDAGDIIFKVFDDNPKGRGSMGMAKLPIKSVFSGSTSRWNLPIGAAPTENDPLVLNNASGLGMLTVEVRPSAPPTAGGAPVAAGAAAPTPATPAAAPAAAPAVPQPQKISVSIAVKEGKDLKVGDVFTSDPLVRIYRNGDQCFQSKAVSSTNNPTWGDAAATVTLTVPSSDNVRINILDEDTSTFSRKVTYDDLGSVVLTAEQISKVLGTVQEYDVIQEDGSKKGKIVVSFTKN